MKTTNNHNQASRMATAFCAAFVFVTGIWAQPKATSGELANCVRRLDMMAANTEKALKYEAPSVAADEIISAFERLEMLANNTENEIRYRIPVEERANTTEYGANNNKSEIEAETDEFLSLNTPSVEYK